MKIKKSKRIISLVLALTMMFTFMAMSASAATTEVPEVQPRASICPQCGGYGYQYWKTVYTNPIPYYRYPQISRGSCTAGPATHVHYDDLPATIYSRCATCGYISTYNTTKDYCAYGGIV